MENPAADDRMEVVLALLDASRSRHGRARLAAEGALPAVLRCLSSSPALLLLPRLCITVNLCCERPNQDAFLEAGGLDRIASVLLSGHQISAEILQTVLQVLGNVALAGEAHKAAVWARFFPIWFREIAAMRNPVVCNSLCKVLNMCCSATGGRRRLGELCEEGRGLPILLDIVNTMSPSCRKEICLYFLLGKACIKDIYFNLVFQRLSSVNTLDDSFGANFTYKLFTKEQVFLLRLLSYHLIAWPDVLDTISSYFALGVLQLLKEAYSVVDASSQSISAGLTDDLAINVLWCSFYILRDICSWKDHSSSASEDPADSLLSAGLLQLLLRYLRELEPPNIVKNHAMQTSTDSKVCPYKGFRRDVVSVLCNFLHGRKQVQDEIRKQDGIPLLLKQCVVDDCDQSLRQWGNLSIRYLLEGNLENQYKVAELEQKEPVITPEIAQMGLRVEIDQESQCPKMVKAYQEQEDDPCQYYANGQLT
ncbi:unnamed protein product [Musa acuminata subsp. malaccensis]|uniref:(wild Malaysian banana) hypothetical protein n=1 Tax=Musa acuminata subsp. malaccensis TaxID=214687 RepID=A0A804IT38_MUSAM|nr:PREDICTED: uncharacterized protein LOC103976126 [Musa acuminata subsp. malaccensis]CAG1843174.1 unnamed protein product [Musa acuminata subsp. malaccensis]